MVYLFDKRNYNIQYIVFKQLRIFYQNINNNTSDYNEERQKSRFPDKKTENPALALGSVLSISRCVLSVQIFSIKEYFFGNF